MTAPQQPAGPLTVAWAYPEGTLSSTWFRAYKRLKRTISRTGLDVRVDLAPITALPDQLDILVAPPSLRAAAKAVVGTHDCVVAGPDHVQQEFDQLMARLLDEHRAEHGRPIPNRPVIHVGFQLVTETAGR